MARTINPVVRILMERDGLSRREAEEMVAETADMLESGDWDAIGDYLGLEDDCLFDVLGF
mgnify:CR=1 FL=1